MLCSTAAWQQISICPQTRWEFLNLFSYSSSSPKTNPSSRFKHNLRGGLANHYPIVLPASQMNVYKRAEKCTWITSWKDVNAYCRGALCDAKTGHSSLPWCCAFIQRVTLKSPCFVFLSNKAAGSWQRCQTVAAGPTLKKPPWTASWPLAKLVNLKYSTDGTNEAGESGSLINHRRCYLRPSACEKVAVLKWSTSTLPKASEVLSDALKVINWSYLV